MADRPKVSVIIPVYNVERYLRECLDSVVEQTLSDIEIICVDDGSTDSSAAILAEYAAKDSRIRIISKGNGGLSSARNAGMEAAIGEYLSFLDSDDYYLSNTLESCLTRARETNADVVFFDAQAFFEDEQARAENPNFETYYQRSGNYPAPLSGQEMFAQLYQNGDFRESACLSLYRREYLESTHRCFIEGITHEDDNFTFLALFLASKTAYISEGFYQRRVRAGSLTTELNKVESMMGRQIGVLSSRDALLHNGFELIANPEAAQYLTLKQNVVRATFWNLPQSTRDSLISGDYSMLNDKHPMLVGSDATRLRERFETLVSHQLTYWLFTTEFPPMYGGGISTYCYHTVEMLKEDYRITVFVPDNELEPGAYIAEELDGYARIRFNGQTPEDGLPLGFHAATSWCFWKAAEKAITQYSSPNIIECQDYLGIGYFTIHKKKELDSRLAQTKIFITAHAPAFICQPIEERPSYHFPEYWMYYLEKYCYLNADGVVYASEYLRELIKQNLNITSCQSLIRNPFRPTSQAERQDFSKLDSRAVYFVSKLSRIKGIEELCQMMKKNYWDNDESVRLMLFGNPGYAFAREVDCLEYLRRTFPEAFSSGLITYHGPIQPEQMTATISQAKVIVAPSLIENFPYAVCEQMQAGKMLLVSHTGGHAEIIEDGVSGFIYQNVEEFCEKLNMMLDMNEHAYEQITTNARQRIEQLCDYSHIYKAKSAFLANLLQSEILEYHFVYEKDASLPPAPPFSPLMSTGLTSEFLSVIVPFFNMQDYIDETIQSVLASSYKDVEILIVDDGSTAPEAKTKLHELDSLHPQVTVLYKPNGGVGSARNYGFKHCRGEYAAIIDADDCVAPDFYSKAIALLKAYANISFVNCHVSYFGNQSGYWVSWDTELPYYLFHNSLGSSCLLYKTAALQAYGLNEAELNYGMEDYESVINLLENGHKGIVITEPLFYYRRRETSMLSNFNYNNTSLTIEKIASKHKDILSRYAEQLYCLFNQNGPGTITSNPTMETACVGLMRDTFLALTPANAIINNTPQPSSKDRLKQRLDKMHVLDIAVACKDVGRAVGNLASVAGRKVISAVRRIGTAKNEM
ncbi:MAG: glycosyltransferase [Coriobacteriales bacterium]|nr:glycosyltransferase [Coriobacteriales bacterium]